MKNIVLKLIILSMLLISCVDNNKSANNDIVDNDVKSPLKFIDRWNELELSQTDDKYGEWGGDTDIIKLYSDGKILYADYLRFLGKAGPPMPPDENGEIKKWYEYKTFERKIDSVKLDDNQIALINKAVIELSKLKLATRTYSSHSGIVNEIMSQDSSFVIVHYPSNEWRAFQELKKSITEK